MHRCSAHTHTHTIQVRGDVLKEDIVEELLDLRDLVGLTHGSVNDWLEKKELKNESMTRAEFAQLTKPHTTWQHHTCKIREVVGDPGLFELVRQQVDLVEEQNHRCIGEDGVVDNLIPQGNALDHAVL